MSAMPANNRPQRLYIRRAGKVVRVRLGGPIQPAYLEVAARIERAIESGELRGGDQLPSEYQLAAAFDTSRETVRRGLLQLADGPLRGEQGRGWVVQEK